jgi:membrane protein DedA with SNARE-associated domain
MLGEVATWVQQVVQEFGPIGVAFLVILENLFPPIPSEVILPFAGYVAERGRESILVMIFAATIGSVLGNLVLYALASGFGEIRVRRFVLRFGRWLTIREPDLNRAEAWFNRHSFLTVAVGRCVPLVRSVVSLPAGFCKMRLSTYILGTAVGSFVWNSVLIGSGAALSSRWSLVESYVGYFQYVLIFAVLILVSRFLFRRYSKVSKAPTDLAE